MPWFKIDDTFAMHEKVMAAGNAAIGLWARAGAWSMQQLTDGFVPDHVLRALGTPKERRTLVEVSLWVEAEGGITFRNWDERQPTKIQVEAARQAAADRQRHARERAKSQRDSRSDKGVSHGPPDPTRPDPTPKDKRVAAVESPKASGRKRPSTAFPEDFTPNETNRQLAAERNLDLNAVVANFKDWNLAKDGRYADWQRALSTWLRREKAQPAVRPVQRIQHVSEIEQPPDGLTPDEYAEWDWNRRQKRAGA